MNSTLTSVCTLVLVAALSGCRYEPPAIGRAGTPTSAAGVTGSASEPATNAQPQQTTPALPPGHPSVEPIAPPQQAASPPFPAVNLISGKVVETMDAAGYTYIRLASGEGERWAAVRQVKIVKGETVTIAAQMQMKDFESKSLNRRFDSIIFGMLATPGAATPGASAAPPTAMPPGHPMAGMGAMPGMGGTTSGASKIEPGNILVAKAEGPGGRTIADLWSAGASLKGKQVVVRGKVVKFLPEIMGKNWIHLQDGSGSKEAANNDLTITTTDRVAAGDIVLVTGTLRTDVNLGAGYTYPVLIEDAKVEKQP